MIQNLAVALCGQPARHRLIFQQASDDNVINEVVLHIQGILSTKDLPPIKARIQ